MLTPIQTLITNFVTQFDTILPGLLTIALIIAGLVLMFGDFRRGRELGFFALVGAAVAFGAQQIASAIHG